MIKIKEIFKYKFKPEKDSYIKFVVKNVTRASCVTIGFKDVETTKQAEMLFMYQFKQLGFKRMKSKLRVQKH